MFWPLTRWYFITLRFSALYNFSCNWEFLRNFSKDINSPMHKRTESLSMLIILLISSLITWAVSPRFYYEIRLHSASMLFSIPPVHFWWPHIFYRAIQFMFWKKNKKLMYTQVSVKLIKMCLKSENIVIPF